MKGFFISGVLISSLYYGQQSISDTLKVRDIEIVNFTKRLPITKEIIHVEKDLSAKNLGQDLPILLKNQTSIVSTSDAGNGIGYTGFRIRGVGGNSINVMLNGVPYNDSESQGTFFVNVPDLTSSASQLVIQRGVGSSSSGVSAFGASVNIITKEPEKDFYVKAESSVGSFATYKYAAEVGSGKFWKNRLSLMGRYSKIHSDGFIDRAFSDLDSYNFTASFEEGKTKVRLLAFGGKEKTYQAWNGIDKETWETRPKFNYSGAIYDSNWENIVGFYNNETDNYKQSHYHLLWNQELNDQWKLETTFHLTDGKGNYDNYKQDAKFSKYNLPNIIQDAVEVKSTDFIRKKWLDNNFYGFVSNLNGKLDNVDLNFGLVVNQYYGRHFGNVSGVQFSDIKDFEYYRNNSLKNEISNFVKAIWKLDRFEIFGDLQLRIINYKTRVVQQGDIEGLDLKKNWTFFNPKAGVNYLIPNGKIYASYALAQREPNRDDLFANPNTKEEKLHDFEAGVEKTFGKVNFSANAYYMNFVNQLVLTGEINNVGEFVRANSGKSYRLGLELGAATQITSKWMISANATFSDNKNLDYKYEKANTTVDLGTTPISFSPNIIANLLLNYKPVEGLSLNLQNQYVGSQFLDNTNNNSFKLKDYFLTDFNAAYGFNINKTEIGLKFILNNIFNKKYVNNGFVYGDSPYYYSQAGTNFMLGVTLVFK